MILHLVHSIAFESDKLPFSASGAAPQLSEEELKRLNNENKEIRLLVKIERIKVRNTGNTGNTGNIYCKFTFADVAPFKVHAIAFP